MDSQQKNPITEGSIYKQLLIFFFPILMGTFFQQLYNTVDAIIIGKFVGKVALELLAARRVRLSICLSVSSPVFPPAQQLLFRSNTVQSASSGTSIAVQHFSRSRDCLRDFHVNTRTFARRHGTSRNGHAGGYLSSCRHISEHIFRRNPVFYDIQYRVRHPQSCR